MLLQVLIGYSGEKRCKLAVVIQGHSPQQTGIGG